MRFNLHKRSEKVDGVSNENKIFEKTQEWWIRPRFFVMDDPFFDILKRCERKKVGKFQWSELKRSFKTYAANDDDDDVLFNRTSFVVMITKLKHTIAFTLT